VAAGLVWALWGAGGEDLRWAGPVLYRSHHGDFELKFMLDTLGAVYLGLASFLTWLVFQFGRTYLHRDPGYKRFYLNLQLFFIGLVWISLSDNLETLVIGWEMVGLSSFLLIGHYRDRLLPVRNALRVVTLYRLADVALLLAIWMTHHHYGYGLTFSLLPSEIADHAGLGDASSSVGWHAGLGALLLLAALVKGGLVPFSSWVARAMEGPTASSAIFYGALSVHLGAFLLLRTEPLWRSSPVVVGAMAVLGLLTAWVAPTIARIQPSVKVQIAYASVGQIGWIFLWIALGWSKLATLHMVLNALLRAYQLLVSPSVISVRMHNLFFAPPRPGTSVTGKGWLTRLRTTIYVLGLKEFGMEAWQRRWLWFPLKRMGHLFDRLEPRGAFTFAFVLSIFGFYGVMRRAVIPANVLDALPPLLALLSLVFVLKAFVERKSVVQAWSLVVVNQIFLALSMGFNDSIGIDQFFWFFSGIALSTSLGLWVINRMVAAGLQVDLLGFQGHVHSHPRWAFLFLLAGLGLAGFPITPTFVGEDLLLDHVHPDQPILLSLIGFSWVLDGLVIYQTYSRLFLGPPPEVQSFQSPAT
jgi:NADH:ubiquinone oxidoreductase subunit 5 (subunit L)/multisubunit Na+/H+ antiporter MnhA subunit